MVVLFFGAGIGKRSGNGSSPCRKESENHGLPNYARVVINRSALGVFPRPHAPSTKLPRPYLQFRLAFLVDLRQADHENAVLFARFGGVHVDLFRKEDGS